MSTSMLAFALIAITHLITAAPATFPSHTNAASITVTNTSTSISTSESNTTTPLLLNFTLPLSPFTQKVQSGLTYLHTHPPFHPQLRNNYGLTSITLSAHNRPPAHTLTDFNLITVSVATVLPPSLFPPSPPPPSYVIVDAGKGWQGPFPRPLDHAGQVQRAWNWEGGDLKLGYEEAVERLRGVGVRGPWTNVLVHRLPEGVDILGDGEVIWAFFDRVGRPGVVNYVGGVSGRTATGNVGMEGFEREGSVDGVVNLVGGSETVGRGFGSGNGTMEVVES